MDELIKMENEVGIKKIKRIISNNNLYYSKNKFINLIEISRRINKLNCKNNLNKIGIYSTQYTLKNDLTPEEPWFNLPMDIFRELNKCTLSYIILTVIDDDNSEYYLLPVKPGLYNFLRNYADPERVRYVFNIKKLEKCIGKTIEGYRMNNEQLDYFIESFRNVI